VNRLRIWLNKKIPSGSLLRNILTLMTGTTFAQTLMILIAPILTRVYDPKYFGSFTVFTSILAIIVVISCFKYELAIVIPSKDKDAANILVLSILICSFVSTVVLILISIFNNHLAFILGAPELRTWLWFLPLSILMAGFFQAFNYWNTRRKQFNRLAVRQITQSMVTSTTQISIGSILNAQAGGLISGHIAGQVVSTGRLIWQTWKDEGKLIISYLSIKVMIKNLVKYKNFPIYSSWSGLLNTASFMMPPLLLGYFFTATVVGFYALGQRVLSLPMNLIGVAVAQAFFPHTSEAYRKGDLDRLTFQVFKNLISISLVPMLLITLIAPDLFSFIFGSNWYEAGRYVRWMSLWLLFVFIASPLSQLYSILEKQRLGLLMDILLFSSRLIVLMLGGLYGDALLTVALFGIVGAILWMLNCVFILNLAGVPYKKVLKVILWETFKGIPYTIFPIFLFIIYDNSLVLILSAILSGLIFISFQIKRVKNLFV
jgi:lipopolysaccharide exporter